MADTRKGIELKRRLAALLLGASDMWAVWQTARYLRGDHDDAPERPLPIYVQRTLETGMIVTYARPFADARAGLPRLKVARGLAAELRDSHRDVLNRRNKVYAHTTESQIRRIAEFSNPARLDQWIAEPEAVFSEEWQSPTGMLDDLLELARLHLDSFIEEIAVIREALSGAPGEAHCSP